MVSRPVSGKSSESTVRPCRFEYITFKSLDGTGHHLVEDMVGTLQRLLGDDTGLFQQVGLNIGTSQLTGSGEVDTDELTLGGDKMEKKACG